VTTSGKNIVFIIDISGSMEGNNEGNISDKARARAASAAGSYIGNKIGGITGGIVSSSIQKETTKLASAKRELEPAIRGLNESTKFTIVTFSDSAAAWNEKLQVADSSNTLKSIVFIERLSATGGTSSLKGLKKALSIKGVDTIFFLSDGQPSDGGPDQILKEVKKIKKKNIKIHTVGLGDDKDENFLRELAEQNGGTYSEG